MSRLTIRTENGAALKLNNPQNKAEARKQLHDKYLIAIEKLAHYEDLEEQGRLMILPCNIGDELYRITYPYRQPPKVTKYRVKNFRTIKRGQKLQLEVQADCVPIRNWMHFEDFYTSREEAEKALAELKGTEK